ncbi:MAG: antibiotic biosynthesis monooxygenase [Actinobacteria bacterium]|nr:antibiotic biosynthesis monooxygenase [Actinomycetota bacterium]
MVIERAELVVEAGREAEFEAALPKAMEILASAPGGRVLAIGRCVEKPSSFVLLMEWESVAVHAAAGESAALQELDKLARSFVAEAPDVGHFEPVR